MDSTFFQPLRRRAIPLSELKGIADGAVVLASEEFHFVLRYACTKLRRGSELSLDTK